MIGAWLANVSFPLTAAFLILLYRLQPHMRALQMSWSQLQGLCGSLEEVRWLLDPAGKPAAPQGSRPFDGLRQAISFDDVSFTYAGSDRARGVLHRPRSHSQRPLDGADRPFGRRQDDDRQPALPLCRARWRQRS